jgi:hypothetical protein
MTGSNTTLTLRPAGFGVNRLIDKQEFKTLIIE